MFPWECVWVSRHFLLSIASPPRIWYAITQNWRTCSQSNYYKFTLILLINVILCGKIRYEILIQLSTVGLVRVRALACLYFYEVFERVNWNARCFEQVDHIGSLISDTNKVVWLMDKRLRAVWGSRAWRARLGMTLEPLLAGGKLHPRAAGQISGVWKARDPQRRRPRRQ